MTYEGHTFYSRFKGLTLTFFNIFAQIPDLSKNVYLKMYLNGNNLIMD